MLPIAPLALAGCGDATEPPAPRPAAVAVTPSSAEIPALGQTARVTVRRSKTDEKAEGAVLFVGSGAAKALKAIRPAGADPATLPAIEDTVRLAVRMLDANGHEITGVAVERHGGGSGGRDGAGDRQGGRCGGNHGFGGRRERGC